jgi:ribonuclease HI
MLFTHRKLEVKPFKFGNLSLLLSHSVKYLGIILNSKLSFKNHLEKIKKCSEQTANQLIRISRCLYGIGMRQSRNLIISVLRSRILFGSFIWATSRNKASIISLMNKIFNSASRIVLGMFHTTPVEVLMRESPLMHFFDFLKRKNHLFLIKKLTGPDSHPIKRLIEFELSHPETHHPSPTHNMLDKQLTPTYDLDHIETIKHHMVNPWDDFNIDIKNFDIKKEEAKTIVEDQIEEISTRQEHLVFTDGSRIPENGTASAAILDRTNRLACRIGNEDQASAFEAEVLAVKLGLDLIINKFYNMLDPFQHTSKKLNFFIDNQAAILAITSRPKPKSNQILFHKIYTKMQLLKEVFDFSISVFWCPAHVEIIENKAVDALAKEATEGHLLRAHNFHRTLANVQQIARKNFKFDKKKKPITRNDVKLVTHPHKIFESLNKLERSESSIIYQLRSGHTPLNSYLHRIKKLNSPNCTTCNTPEDVQHFLIKCRRFNNERKTL